jgi:hypothetical protein
LLHDNEQARFVVYCRQTGTSVNNSPRLDRSFLLKRGYAMEPIATNPNKFIIAMPLYDTDRNPTSIIAIELPDTAAWRSQTECETSDLEAALRDVSKSIGEIENHYSHLDPDTINLNGNDNGTVLPKRRVEGILRATRADATAGD